MDYKNIKIKSITEDGIYKLSLKDTYDYLFGKGNHDFKKGFQDVFHDVIIQQDEECVSWELEDIMYGIKFKQKTDNKCQGYFYIKDYYIALPALFYILFELLKYAREYSNVMCVLKIWGLIHYLTESDKYFNLPNEKNSTDNQ